MSQDVSTNQGVKELLSVPPPIQPWSPENEADRLMDELFSDIDRILDGGSKLPTEPAKPEYVSLKPIVIPQITTPSAVTPSQELLEEPSTELTSPTPVEPLATNVVHTTSPPDNRSRWSFEKLLLVGGLASLGVTIILLLTSQRKLTLPWVPNFGASPSTENEPPPPQDFSSYMLRSLEVIDHKSKPQQQTTPPSPPSTPNLASIPVPSNRSLASNQSPTVLERVYIPVPMPQTPVAPPANQLAARYTLPANPLTARPTLPANQSAARLALPANQSAARPTLPANQSAARPTLPANQLAARPTLPAPSPRPRLSLPIAPPPVRPSASAPSTAAKPSIPAPPKAVTQPSTPPPPPAVETSPTAQSALPVANHTLVGLLELGDNSAALFEINGITQRIKIGESIGASGWALVSVANQEAVVRRNGEVRSVFVGQKF